MSPSPRIDPSRTPTRERLRETAAQLTVRGGARRRGRPTGGRIRRAFTVVGAERVRRLHFLQKLHRIGRVSFAGLDTQGHGGPDERGPAGTATWRVGISFTARPRAPSTRSPRRDGTAPPPWPSTTSRSLPMTRDEPTMCSPWPPARRSFCSGATAKLLAQLTVVESARPLAARPAPRPDTRLCARAHRAPAPAAGSRPGRPRHDGTTHPRWVLAPTEDRNPNTLDIDL